MPANGHILPVTFDTNQRFTVEHSATLLESRAVWKGGLLWQGNRDRRLSRLRREILRPTLNQKFRSKFGSVLTSYMNNAARTKDTSLTSGCKQRPSFLLKPSFFLNHEHWPKRVPWQVRRDRWWRPTSGTRSYFLDDSGFCPMVTLLLIALFQSLV